MWLHGLVLFPRSCLWLLVHSCQQVSLIACKLMSTGLSKLYVSYQREPSLHCFAISDVAVTLSFLLCEVVSSLGELPPWFGPVCPKTGLLLACELLCFSLNPLLGFGLVLVPCFDRLVLRGYRWAAGTSIIAGLHHQLYPVFCAGTFTVFLVHLHHHWCSYVRTPLIFYLLIRYVKFLVPLWFAVLVIFDLALLWPYQPW